MWTCIIQINIQICTNLRSADTPKKLRSFEKRASPLSPVTSECVRLVPKIWDTDACDLGHWLVRFRFCTRTIRTPHPRFETYTNPFPCHIANPIWFWHRRARRIKWCHPFCLKTEFWCQKIVSESKWAFFTWFYSRLRLNNKPKTPVFSFGGKLLTDEKSPPLIFRLIFIPTHHFFFFFFSLFQQIGLEKAVERSWGVDLVNSLPKVHSKVR